MRFVCRFWGRALLLLCCSTALWAQDAPLALEHAKAEISINGVSTFATVDLPYGWDFHHRGLSGVGQFDLSFDGPLTTDEAWGLYFYRLGNAYRVTLNGKLLEGDGDIAALGIGDYAKVPRFIRIPADLLLPHNQLEVVIRSDSGRRSGMPVVWVGPVSGVEDLYRKEFAFRVGGVRHTGGVQPGGWGFCCSAVDQPDRSAPRASWRSGQPVPLCRLGRIFMGFFCGRHPD